MRILICGSRNWIKLDAIENVLNQFDPRRTIVLHGMAHGADTQAGIIAIDKGFDVETYPAEWDKYGRFAGFKRNIQMLDEGKPHLVIAFQLDNSRGTQHTINEARKRNIPVEVINE